MVYYLGSFAPCGGTLRATTTSRAIFSPGWPRNYTNNVYCRWIITAPRGYQVKLIIPRIVTEFCCDDFAVSCLIISQNHIEF